MGNYLLSWHGFDLHRSDIWIGTLCGDQLVANPGEQLRSEFLGKRTFRENFSFVLAARSIDVPCLKKQSIPDAQNVNIFRVLNLLILFIHT
jgi:hypothetical protein